MASASVPPPRAEILTADTERDPEGPLKWLAFSVAGLSVLQILLFGFGRDQTIYAMVGQGVLDGGLPYRDYWDFKPPGIFLVHALSFGVLGRSMVAPRITEALLVFGAVLGCRRLGGKLFESRTAGLLGGALYALIHAQLEFWHTGQPESIGGPLTIFSLVLLTHEFPRKRAWLGYVLVGLLLGFLFLLKPTLAFVALPMAAYAFHFQRRAGRSIPKSLLPTLWMGLTSALPIVLCAFWFWVKGALPDLVWTLFEFTPGYTKLGWTERGAFDLFSYGLIEALFRMSYLAGAGLLLALFFDRRTKPFRAGYALILGCILVQVAGIAMQAKFFQYHYGATMPLVGLLGGIGLYRLYRRIAVGNTLGALGLLGFCVGLLALRLPVRDVPHGFWERSLLRLQFVATRGHSRGKDELDDDLYRAADFSLGATRDVGRYLHRTTPLGSPIFVWGFEPGIYWFGAKSPSTRFLYNVPQRSNWQREKARRDLLAELGRRPPAAIVVQENDLFPFVTGDKLDSLRALPTFPELERLLAEDYVFDRKLEDFSIYLRRPNP